MRLTVHHLGPSESALRLAVATQRPNVPERRWAKLVEAFGEAAAYRQALPGVQLVGRTIGHDDWPASSFDPLSAAETDFARVLDQARRNPLIRYWESGNEINPGNYAEMAKIAAYDLRFMDLAEAHGLRAVVGNFAVGQPGPRVDVDDDAETVLRYWHAYREVLIRAERGGHLVGLHEYIGLPRRPGEDEDTWPDDTWLQFRYRRLLAYCRRERLTAPRLMITETGVDAVAGSTPWRQRFGDTAEGLQAYAECLVRYELGLRADGEAVVAAALFTSGTLAQPKWQPYNVDGSALPERLAAWAAAHPEGLPPPPAQQAGAAQVELARLRPPFAFYCRGRVPLYAMRAGGPVFVRMQTADYTVHVPDDLIDPLGRLWWKIYDPAGSERDLWMPAFRLVP